MSNKKLGEFCVESGELVVSDPCYPPGIWCAGKLDQVQNGTWKAEVRIIDADDFGERVAELYCYADGFPAIREEPVDFKIGVDSGQAGIFDAKHYRSDENAKNWVYQYESSPLVPDDAWYSMCCDVTLATEAGIIPYGVVSSTGFGDGAYPAYIGYDQADKVSWVRITYIEKDEI